MNGRIPQAFIDDVVARSDIVEIIGSRVVLKKAGREFKACCPFHNEKTPSFWVSPDKQFYHCFGCGAHGTVVGFLMQHEKMEFLEAMEDLAQRVGLELPRTAAGSSAGRDGPDFYEPLANAAKFFEQNLKDSPRARAYAEKRGIDEASAARFNLGYAPDSWNALLNRFGNDAEQRRRAQQMGLIIEKERAGGEREAGFYDRFRDRLMFPIRDPRGRVIAFGGRVIDQGEPKYLNSPETPLFHKGRELYGLYEARQARADFSRLLVVEGYMDVVRLHQAGIAYAVATLGTATTQEHLNKIFRLTSEVVFCFDGDRAGRQAAWRALENALPMARDGREMKFLFLPEGEDPDSLVAAQGAEKFEARIKSAMPLSEYLMRHLAESADLATVDGRAKLAATAQPLFARIPVGVFRELMTDRLAQEIRMPAAKLQQLLLAPTHTPLAAAQTPEHAHRARRERASAGRGNLLRQAITLVLHFPAAAKSVPDQARLTRLQLPGIQVLCELVSQAQGLEHPNTAMLLERWRERHEFERLSELAATAPLVGTVEAAAAELGQALQKLEAEQGPGRRTDELLRKARDLGLNDVEKAELNTLLKSRV